MRAPSRHAVAAGALVLALASWAFAAHATVVEKLSTAQLTRRAERVVRGVVRSQQAVWAEDRRQLVTVTELEVLESYKGQGRVALVQPGGELDGVASWPAGVARLRVGDEVIVFAEKAPMAGSRFVPVAMASSIYQVVRDPARARVHRHLEGLSFAIARSGAPVALEQPAPVDELGSLDEVSAEIRSALKAR